MKKILITGCSGFVARHFLNFLLENQLRYRVLGVDIKEPEFPICEYAPIIDFSYQKLNLLDRAEVEQTVKAFEPDYILHLASFSSVAYSWQYPAECLANNTSIFMNLMEALRQNGNTRCRVLSIGSSEEYGNVSEEKLPLKEDMELLPVNPYAAARVSQEIMANVLVKGYGMQIIQTRSFNHIGQYQDERFVIPSFIRRILDVAKTGAECGVIETGDVSIVRDFLDVKDVVRAYYLLLMEGISGEIYNICSGKGISLETVIHMIAEQVGVEISPKINMNFVRPDDSKKIIGSYEKIYDAFGWRPEIPIHQTLHEMIDQMRGY